MIIPKIYEHLEHILAELNTQQGWNAKFGLNLKEIQFTVEPPPQGINADLATNIGLVLAKKVKQNPKMITELFIPKLTELLTDYAEVTFSPPGFINFRLIDRILYDTAKDIFEGKEFKGITYGNNTKVLLEFISANPTGPLHIGHGRGAVLGDFLARAMEYLGYKVDTEYYINDAGRQMNLLGLSVKTKYRELMNLPVITAEKDAVATDGYRGEYITDLAKTLIDKPGINPEDTVFFRKYAIENILNNIKTDLATARIEFKNWFSETTLYEKGVVKQTCEILTQKGLAYQQDNALWFKSTLSNDDKDRVLVRSDGNPTYFASDIAYHQNKLDRGYTKLIDIWGADHHGYAPRLNAVMNLMGYPKEVLTIILYQLVRLSRQGQPVVMSTRAGEFITFAEVMKEVGIDATRYFLLLRTPDTHLDFDLDLAKKQSLENPVYYIQYAHTRICGIEREAIKQNITPNTEVVELLKDDIEQQLLRKLCFFNDTVLSCVEHNTAHFLTSYLYTLAGLFHKYYDSHRVVVDDKNISSARLLLMKAVQSVLCQGFSLLGITAPDKM
ncbi:MAG: arginine--tRNA ligase [Elusimicrobiota bacterium]